MDITALSAEIFEARIKKIVNRRGFVRKTLTAGRAGKKVVGGHIRSIDSSERRNSRMGQLKRKRTLRGLSSSRKRRSALFAAKGRAKRKLMHVHDTRHG